MFYLLLFCYVLIIMIISNLNHLLIHSNEEGVAHGSNVRKRTVAWVEHRLWRKLNVRVVEVGLNGSLLPLWHWLVSREATTIDFFILKKYVKNDIKDKNTFF